eukprot:XP_003887804.1 hypothetical protein EHEL_081230 [Encephalitozoon hellem ATCC 50504]
MKVLKVFEEEGRIYVVQKHMSLGPVDRFIRDQILLSDDFIFYVFMQIVYAMKINGDEGWFWDRMSPRYIWIDEDGKVRICWADVILGNMKGVGEYVGRWSGCGNDVSLKSKADGESISFGNLRRIFVELALNPSQSYRMACSSEDLQDLSLLGRKESLSPVLDGFASLLFEERGRMSDLEDYTRRMIQEKRIASNPREILGALKVIIEETNRTDGFSTLEEMKMKENSGEASKIEDSESTGGSEEGSKSVSGSRVDDERVESFGTREYKRGRFHVCEAVPLGEREKGLQMSEHMKRMVRVVNAQSRQIGLLTKALRQSGLLDKEMDEEIGELEELAGFLLFGMERQ